jgi:hypothetical protein
VQALWTGRGVWFRLATALAPIQEDAMTDSTVASVHGTPDDYGDTLYRVYFEVGEWEGIAREAIIAFLVERASDHPAFDFDDSLLHARPHGYEVDLPMQLIPEVVRALAERNVAVYQVVRLGGI